ncbi:MAG: hypothetical protein EA369_00165 [Bradymonadales bacterium]|nr:MAG: hypothetical protein EA369_00165 [Bradymonadales bacterium]
MNLENPGFYRGLALFFRAAAKIFSDRKARGLYMAQVLRSLVFGLIFWALTCVLFGILLWFLFKEFQNWIPWMWVEGMTGVGLVLIWLFVSYFFTGPITLLIVGLYLSQVTPWQKMQQDFDLELPPIQEPPLFQTIVLSLWRGILLIFVIAIGAILAVIPPLFLISPLFAAYALGKDWLWSVRDLFRFKKVSSQADWTFCMGTGLLPSLLSSIPLVGLLTLPILQVATLMRFEEQTKVDS